MFNPKHDRGIVLRRVSYAEADRIISVLTEHSGKLSLIAKGARKSRSKLAGGIELITLNEIGYIQGKRDLGTLVSSRMLQSWPKLLTNIDRTMFAYSLIKRIDKITEDNPEDEFYKLLLKTLNALEDQDIPLSLIQIWSSVQLLKLSGQQPNLDFNVKSKQPLNVEDSFNFDLAKMGFYADDKGTFDESHIKFFRLLAADHDLKKLNHISGTEQIISQLNSLVEQLADISSNV